jgi:hypothetical protein
VPAARPEQVVDALSATHKVYDFDLVPIIDQCLVVQGFLDDHQVALDGDAPGIDAEAMKQLGNGERPIHAVRLTVEANNHG